jgi:hypothetical protein
MVNKKLFDKIFNVHKQIFLNLITPFDGLEKDVATMHEDNFLFIDEDDSKEVNVNGKNNFYIVECQFKIELFKWLIAKKLHVGVDHC